MFWLSYECFSIVCDAFFAKKGSSPVITAVRMSRTFQIMKFNGFMCSI